MSRLEHDPEPPHRVIETRELGRFRRHALFLDEVEWPNGDRGPYIRYDAPSSAFVVPYFDDGTTVLVRQWRHSWKATAWEVPAGTMEDGEDPLVCARRELAEEAGVEAGRWDSLGVTHGSAVIANTQHLYLARDCREVATSRETYERDMIVRRLAFVDALDEALAGGIAHAGSVAALARAARLLGIASTPPR